MQPRRDLRVAAGLTALALLLGLAVYVRVGGEKLNLATGLLLIAAVFTAILALTDLGLRLLKASPATHTSVRVSIVTTAALLVGVELILRFGLGTYMTYLEKNEGGSYQLRYHHTSPTWFQVYSPNTQYTISRPEFAYPRRTNSLGLAEREIPSEKGPNEYRIIALGDSYTEGVGVAYNETWIKVTERRLASATVERAVVAFNAGISGSDPWYEYMLLREKLLPYEPDLVLVAINASDITDAMNRGGQERFQADGTTRVSHPPQWEWLYGISYLFRHVIHDVLRYNWLLIRESALKAEQQKAIHHVVEAASAFAALGHERGFRVLIVLHPDHWEADHQTYEEAFAEAVDTLTRLPGLDVVDVLARWKSTGVLGPDGASSLYWSFDGHNNSKGYAAFGETVADRILHSDLMNRE